MKKIIIIIAIFLCVGKLSAQETLFCTKEGAVLTYKTYDSDGKEIYGYTLKIKKVNQKGNDINIIYETESIDKSKSDTQEEITFTQKNNIIYFDMRSFLENKNSDKSKIKIIEGGNLTLPVNLTKNMTLPEAKIKLSYDVMITTIEADISISNRKVTDVKDLKVKGGTFKSYKVEESIVVKSMMMDFKTKTHTWYAKGIGMIKTETFDEKGKLTRIVELVNVKY